MISRSRLSYITTMLLLSGTPLLGAVNQTVEIPVSNNPQAATFSADPSADKDVIRVYNATKIKATCGFVMDDPGDDGAQLTAKGDSFQENNKWYTTVDVEGRGGIGAVYKVEGKYEGGGGGGDNTWWSKAKDKTVGEALVLLDLNGQDTRTDVANGGPTPPTTLYATSGTNNKGRVKFWISSPAQGASYTWSVCKKADDSEVAHGDLTNQNSYTKDELADLDMDRYYVLVERQGIDRKIDFTVCGLKVENVSDPNNPATVAEDDYLYITDAPAMPAVRGTFLPQIQGMQVTMQLVVTYTRTDRDDSTPFPAQPAQVNAGTAWDVNWGNDVIGGKAVFTCNIDSRFKKQLTFHIRGTNPTENAAETYLKGGNRPWYLYAIAKQESGTQNNRTYLQFNEIGTLGPGADDYKKCPNRGADPGGTYGWGMMQLTTPKPNKVQLWHWKSNVDGALTFINNTCKPAAVAWKNRQVTQQQAEEPTKPLANKVFTWVNVNFQEETAKTAVEALTIQRYNGAAKWVWYWKNKTPTTPGSWEQRNDSYADYLKSVLGKL